MMAPWVFNDLNIKFWVYKKWIKLVYYSAKKVNNKTWMEGPPEKSKEHIFFRSLDGTASVGNFMK